MTDLRITHETADSVMVSLRDKGFGLECQPRMVSLSGEYPVLSFVLGEGGDDAPVIWFDTTWDGDDPAADIFPMVNWRNDACEARIWRGDAQGPAFDAPPERIADDIIRWYRDAIEWIAQNEPSRFLTIT